jgi:hypothetical protein
MIDFGTLIHGAGRRLAGAALASVAVSAAGAETLKASYSVSLIGLSIGSATASGVIEPQNYRIDIGLKTTGLANLVNSAKGAATATGTLAPIGPAPATYANSTANAHETRTVRMALGANTVRALEVKPEPWDAPVRIPVSDDNRRNIVDPVSALIMSVPAGASVIGPAACNRTIPVFDGVTRFDVQLSYVETRTARTHGYTGPVTVCAARYTPISGHRPDSASTKYMAENGDMSVWLAPLPNAHVVVPLRMDIRTSVGELVIEAAEFQIGERAAALGGR